MTRKIFAISILIALSLSGISSAELLAGLGIAVAETENGKLQGFIRDGIFTYHGVQYAAAEPFMPPVKGLIMGRRETRAELRLYVAAEH